MLRVKVNISLLVGDNDNMFERAYAYVNYNRHAIIRLYLDRNYNQIVNDLDGSLKYIHIRKTGVSREDLLWRKSPQAVSELVVINNREIEVVLYEVSSEVEIQLYDNNNVLNSSARINLIEGSSTSVSKEKKSTQKTLAITSNNKILVWRDTYEFDFGSDSYIKAKIIDDNGNVVALMGGYHIRKNPLNINVYSGYSAYGAGNLGGLDCFKFFFKLEPMTDKFYTFLYEIQSSNEIFEEKLWFDSTKNFFIKELPEEERWREYDNRF